MHHQNVAADRTFGHRLAGSGKTGNTMELHQIRYFLALEKTLNFTRAAEECNVSQPALSRAIAQLEAELGSELFRRERSLTHLTSFGKAVKPELQRCFESSLRAKSVAREYLKEGHAPLSILLARTVEMEALSPIFNELARAFPRIELRMSRNPPHEIGEKLKAGDAEIAISGPLEDEWSRLETHMLYQQFFGLLMNKDLADKHVGVIEVQSLKGVRLLSRPHCPLCDKILAMLQELGDNDSTKLEVPSVDDVPELVQSRLGVGIWPVSRKLNGEFLISQVRGMDMSRWIRVHTVFGRRLSPGASALVGLLRAKDWSAAIPASTKNAESVH
jgi:DNA-binding transcriptional LysR family regulator